MTINSTVRIAGPFPGNGAATSFPFAFKVFDKTDLQIILTDSLGNETTLTLDSDYSITVNVDQDASPGGSITYPLVGLPMPSGFTLAGVGSLPNLQKTDITNSGGFYPQVIEDALDYLTILVQQTTGFADSTVRFPVTEQGLNQTLPPAVARAGKALIFGPDGSVTVSPDDYINQTANTAASAAAALASQTASEAARDLAQAWASQPSGAVNGTGLLSAFQYAQLAAAGIGLPQFLPTAIPTTDHGDIHVIGIGDMEWVAATSRYERIPSGNGQCQFTFISATQCRLIPLDGNGLIINGRQYRIPSAGINIANTGLAVGNTYYAYAHDDGTGGVALELSTTIHAAYTDGTHIKTGDPTRALVGGIFVNPTGQFQDDNMVRGVASWFNQPSRTISNDLNSTTFSNTGAAQIAATLFVLMLRGGSLDVGMIGAGSMNTINTSMNVTLGADGIPSGQSSFFTSSSSTVGILHGIGGKLALQRAAGLHSIQLFGNVTGGIGSINVSYSASASEST